MPNTRDIRRRIKSVQSTRQLTKAMKMVSAAKLREKRALTEEISREVEAALKEHVERFRGVLAAKAS